MEIRDIYHVDRTKTPIVKERKEELLPGEYIMVVHLCLFNSQGKMLIQKRQPHKKGWSGLWDVTVGGSSVSGETSQQAITRETMEEIGLQLDFTALRPFLTMNFPQGFDDYYIVHANVDINALTLQQSEVEQVAWATQEEDLQLLKAENFVPYYEAFIQLLFTLNQQGSPGAISKG